MKSPTLMLVNPDGPACRSTNPLNVLAPQLSQHVVEWFSFSAFEFGPRMLNTGGS